MAAVVRSLHVCSRVRLARGGADRSRAAARLLLRRPQLSRASRRHARLGAARQRRPARRPLVQVSPPARHPHGRARRSRTRWSSCAPARGASRTRARRRSSSTTGSRRASQNRWPSLALRPDGGQLAARAAPVGRLLLQDLHVAGVVLGEGLRAADPPRRRPRPRRRRARSRQLREGVRVLRRAGRSAPAPPGLIGGARRRAAPARASSCASEDFRARRPAAGRAARDRRQAAAPLGARRRRPSSRRCPRCGFCTRTHRVRRLRRRHLRRARARQRPSRRPPRASAAPALWRIVAKRCVLAAGAIERPLVFGGNDRPGVMLAGAVRAYLNRFAVAPGSRAVVFTTDDDGWRTAADLARRRGASPPSSTRATRRRAGRRGRQDAGARLIARRCRPRRAGAPLRAHRRADRAEARRCASTAICSPCRAAGTRPLHLTSHLGGSRSGTRPSRPSCPARCRPAWRWPAPRRATLPSRTRCADGARPARRRPRSCGFTGRRVGLRRRPTDEPGTRPPLWRVRGHARQGLRRPPERRHRRRRRARASRGLPRGRASQALHHARHGDRPGQDLQPERPRAHGRAHRPRPSRDRHHHVPPAVHAGRDRRAGRPRTAARSSGRRACTPAHAWAAEQGAVFVESRAMAAGAMVPEAGRAATGSRASTARCARCATRVGVCDVSTLGKIDVQGADAAAFLDRVYVNSCQTLAVGKARYGLMLREDGFVMDDGTDVAPRARPLPRHHHHGQRRQGHAAPGVLPPGAVAGARRADGLGHRAVGAVRDRRPALARRAAKLVDGGTTSRTRPSPIWPRPS